MRYEPTTCYANNDELPSIKDTTCDSNVCMCFSSIDRDLILKLLNAYQEADDYEVTIKRYKNATQAFALYDFNGKHHDAISMWRTRGLATLVCDCIIGESPMTFVCHFNAGETDVHECFLEERSQH